MQYNDGTNPFNLQLPIILGQNISVDNRKLEQFLKALQSHYSNTPLIDRLVFKYLNDLPSYTTSDSFEKETFSMEAIVSAMQPMDVGILISNIYKTKRCVCMIEYINGEGNTVHGTGFLIGPTNVMTNYHVIEPIKDRRDLLSKVNLVFDYERDGDALNANPSITFKLSVDRPIEIYSPYSRLDEDLSADPNQELDYPDDLCDFAILNLQEEVGNLPFGLNNNSVNISEKKDEARGWLEIPVNIKDLNTWDIFIIQHPDGRPQKIGIGLDQVIGYSPNKRRIRHKVNTEGGTSGSPIVDRNFNLIGIHNAGYDSINLRFNQGVTMLAIVEYLNEKEFFIDGGNN